MAPQTRSSTSLNSQVPHKQSKTDNAVESEPNAVDPPDAEPNESDADQLQEKYSNTMQVYIPPTNNKSSSQTSIPSSYSVEASNDESTRPATGASDSDVETIIVESGTTAFHTPMKASETYLQHCRDRYKEMFPDLQQLIHQSGLWELNLQQNHHECYNPYIFETMRPSSPEEQRSHSCIKGHGTVLLKVKLSKDSDEYTEIRLPNVRYIELPRTANNSIGLYALPSTRDVFLPSSTSSSQEAFLRVTENVGCALIQVDQGGRKCWTLCTCEQPSALVSKKSLSFPFFGTHLFKSTSVSSRANVALNSTSVQLSNTVSSPIPFRFPSIGLSNSTAVPSRDRRPTVSSQQRQSMINRRNIQAFISNSSETPRPSIVRDSSLAATTSLPSRRVFHRTVENHPSTSAIMKRNSATSAVNKRQRSSDQNDESAPQSKRRVSDDYHDARRPSRRDSEAGEQDDVSDE